MSKKRKKKSFLTISRKRQAVIYTICLLFLLILILLDRSDYVRSIFLPYNSAGRNLSDMEKYHSKTFTVIKVVDGDTINIDFPDGNDFYTRIRLLGVDTPETKHPQYGVQFYGPQSAEFTKEMTLDKNVTLYLIEGDTRGYYGRLLAYVKLPDGEFLNELLIAEGYGYAYLPYDHLYYNQYKHLESAARREKKGLWEEITVDKMPTWRQKYEEN